MDTQESFQDFQQGVCFGCGVKNEHGLQIKSFPVDGKVICDWQPEPHHCAGTTFMNGGIIATILDCHMGCAAIQGLHKEVGESEGVEPVNLHCVTGNLNVNYLAPTPMDDAVHLEAWTTRVEGKKVFVEATLTAKGTITANATALFIRVDRSKSILD